MAGQKARSGVFAPEVPAISMRDARRPPKLDHREKLGDDWIEYANTQPRRDPRLSPAYARLTWRRWWVWRVRLCLKWCDDQRAATMQNFDQRAPKQPGLVFLTLPANGHISQTVQIAPIHLATNNFTNFM
jgi:hypothetical protein